MSDSDTRLFQEPFSRFMPGVLTSLTVLLGLLLGLAISHTFTTDPRSSYAIPIMLVILGTFVFLLFHHGVLILLGALAIRSSLEAMSGFDILGGLSLSSMLAIGILVLTLIRLALDRKIPLAFNDRTFPYLLLAGWGLFSGLVINRSSWSFAVAGAEIARMLSNISIFWLVIAFVKTRKDFTLVLLAMVISALIPLAGGFWGLLQGSGTSVVLGIPSLVRIKGFFAHPNNYAHYLIIIGLCVYTFYRWSKIERVRFEKHLLLLLSVIIASLVLTFSRSGLIGLVLAILLVGINNSRSLLKILLLIAILGLIFALLFPSFIEYTFTQTLTSSDPSESTLASRYWIWEQGYEWATINPVAGNGPDSFVKLVRIDAHNDYLRILVEYGIPGLLFFGWVTLIQLKDGWRLMNASKRLLQINQRNIETVDGISGFVDFQKGYILARSFLSLLIAIIVMGAGANIFNFPVLQWYVFAFWGLVVVYYEHLNRQ